MSIVIVRGRMFCAIHLRYVPMRERECLLCSPVWNIPNDTPRARMDRLLSYFKKPASKVKKDGNIPV